MNNFDCVIIGYGPCGISCGIYLKRYGYNPVIIGKDYGALEKAHMIENLYGAEKLSGIELAKKGIEQAKEFNIPVITDEVLDIEIDQNLEFNVKCKNEEYHSKTVMLALGKSRNKFYLAKDFEGKGVSYCATCDGFFYRKKKVGIIGNGLFMAHELDVLAKMIPDITVFTNGLKLEVEIPDGVKLNTSKIKEFYGNEKLEGVVLDNESKVEIDGMFIALGSQSGFSLASHLGIELDGTDIVVDKDCKTNIDGVYAGGDVIGGLLQVSKAISDGAIAATAISKYLKK